MKGLPTLLALCVMGGGWLLMHHINSSGGHCEEVVDVAEVEDAVASDTLVLPEGKLKASNYCVQGCSSE